MIRRPPRSTHCISSAASDVYKRQYQRRVHGKAHDYMDYIQIRYGVYSVSLYVDGKRISNYNMDYFSEYENRMVNSCAYDGYMKSFRDPGNMLRALHTDESRGIININEERDYKFLYVLKDVHGNISRYAFTVRGKNCLLYTSPSPRDQA
eukprot:TRINITY_DN17259_c0_g1_i1.p2 TRINITY_DN17259_c0_g1~~TRINITY_DN17259_c0_g1_i1.p2  ORF type:complete len:150 (-),score=22.20 TRINITY_DN17259_c0_g1_i1:87-536(-)